VNVIDPAIVARRVHTLSDKLARFTLGLNHAEIPARIRDRAKHLILDAVGTALAARKYEFAKASFNALAELGAGSSPVIGGGRRLAPREAAIMNGVLMHGLDYDDTHSRGVIHGTVSSFPCVFSLADKLGADGAAILTAYVAAMEVSTRVGAVAKGGFHQVGFHPTGLVGAFGATLAAARLLELDVERAVMAQGIALSMASGSLEFLEDGAWTKRIHPGWAASVGITAATLAKHGFIGPRAAYEGRFGLFAIHLGSHIDAADINLATDGLGRVWQIDEVSIKPFPACHFTHAAIDAALALHRKASLAGRDISRVTVLVPGDVVKTVCEPVANKQAPANSYDAQFSIPYLVATALLRGRFTLDELEPEAMTDSSTLALMKRVGYEVDLASTFPRHYTGEVVVELASGETFRHREAVNRGNADRPISNGEIEEKYMDNAMREVGRDEANNIRDVVLTLDAGPIGKLASTLSREN
jgi:2-methylcitrate dehydratase PrpD